MRFLPPEWHRQSFVQLTWPDEFTDWADNLDETLQCYRSIAREISRRERLVIVTRCADYVTRALPEYESLGITIVEAELNDTWARDHSFITVIDNGAPVLLDFQFNGWGLKFASDRDNLINRSLYAKLLANGGSRYENRLSTVLEGGSIESDGRGTLLTTSECLLSPNRNGAWDRERIEAELKSAFGAERVLWLHNGYLAGDDTDSHIDTLARFAPSGTIMYVRCTDEADEHYAALSLMERELQALTDADGRPYRLVPLPMCSPVSDNGERLPATYANFLYVNGAVLVPTYGLPEDEAALDVFRRTFPDRDIVGINCRALIRQHGSLHCVTMQYPEEVKL